jgi:hypothetical protein
MTPGTRRPKRAFLAAVPALALVPVILFAACQSGGAGGIGPSFSHDVAPLIADKCAGCHQAGGIAPFALTDTEEIADRSGLIGAAVQERLMPPWPPGGGSPAYAGEAERTLTDRERATLVAWADAGGRVDGPALEPRAQPGVQVHSGETLLRLRMQAAYRPQAPAGATDDYRCFIVDPQLARDSFVTSVRIEPGQRKVVHHVILFRVHPDQVAEAEGLDASSPGQGWQCFGDSGLSAAPDEDALDDADWVAAWAPGWGGGRLPEGTGVPLEAGSRLVMQVHYNLLNGRAPDRSQALVTVAPASAGLEPLKTMLMPAPVELPCADGESGPLCDREAALLELARKYGPDAAFTPAGLLFLCGGEPGPDTGGVTTCERRVHEPVTIRVVAGHMHLLGSSIKIELNPGGEHERVLLDIPRWDFHWQNGYLLEKPVGARVGDVIRVTCHHDVGKRTSGQPGIPTEPRYILWGEGTTDEMCLGLLQVTHGLPR